jgi:hypothetical protein
MTTHRQYEFLVTGKGWVCNPINDDHVTGIRMRWVGDWQAIPLDGGKIPKRVLKDCHICYEEDSK